MRQFFLVLFVVLACAASAEPIDLADIRVIDGDTIRVHHKQPNVRLIGLNAPENRHAACEAERELVGRFHGSNHMPTKIGPSGCSCEMPVNEEAMMAADMIGFMELVV